MENILTKKYSPMVGNTNLFLIVFFAIFLIPLFPVSAHRILYNFSYTAIFFIAIFLVQSKRRFILWGAVLATITEWMAAYMDMLYLREISYLVNVMFFAFIVGKMIYEIANTPNVNVRVIVEAINCYLLLGFIFSLMVTFVMMADPDAYNFPWVFSVDRDSVSRISEILYYTFVTFSTLGYGDVVPQTPLARSLAIFISVTGQIYIAIIIAMLVGKFASTQQK